MRRTVVSFLTLALLSLCLTAAGAEGNIMKFAEKEMVVFVGETLQTELTREGIPAEGTLTYTSSNEKAAAVDENGLVTGLAKGKTTITAVAQTEKKAYRTQMNVTVAQKVTSVEVNTKKLALYEAADPAVSGLLEADGEDLPVLLIPVKKSVSIQAEAKPREAAYRKLVYAGSDERILRVQGSKVTGAAPGEAILTISSEKNPEVCVRYRVLVVQPVTRIELAASAPSVAAGEQIALTAKTLPDNATMTGVVWSSGNETVAAVDENGVVTGLKKGSVRVTASAADGSNIRASLNLKVTQKATGIRLDQTERTIDVGKSAVLKASVEPRNADDRSVIWTSSDESIATVNGKGRVTGVNLGTCRIICTSASSGDVAAAATIHVQQPVTKIIFGQAPLVYMGETARLSWTVQPGNASNPALTFTSSNKKVLTVSEDGTLTPVRCGEAWIHAVTTDGSNRRAKVKVRVVKHVEGVHMLRHTAYIDVKETATAGAVIEPKEAGNHNMTWESDDSSVATVSGTTNRVKITGVSRGMTRVTGTTEDGGFQTSITVRIDDWDHALRLNRVESNMYGDVLITMKNISDLNITRVNLELEFYLDGKPVPVNAKDGSNKVTATYKRSIAPGSNSVGFDNLDKYYANWIVKDYQKAETGFNRLIARITSYQIDNDWVKTIRERNRPAGEWRY